MALIASSGDSSLDSERCVQIAIAHDIAEALAGDITPYDGISKERKHEMETKALETMCAAIGADYPQATSKLRELWTEYEHGVTTEALLLKDLDKVEMIAQVSRFFRSHAL